VRVSISPRIWISEIRATRGIVDKSPDLAGVMAGHDAVINAADNVAEASAFTKLVPIKLALALAFKQKVPELTITYEDAAEVILDNLSKGGCFSHRRVGVALPPGLRKHKDDVPR
jgi:hypothetical protein